MQKTIPTCRDCHSAIHRFVSSEKELGRYFNSVETLLGHPEIGRFVDWVKRQKKPDPWVQIGNPVAS